MIELLQNLQLALGYFVAPLVFAMCSLLLLAIIVYATAVLLN